MSVLSRLERGFLTKQKVEVVFQGSVSVDAEPEGKGMERFRFHDDEELFFVDAFLPVKT